MVGQHALVARSQVGTLEPPYEIDLCFYYAQPKTPSYPWPSQKDLDKVARATIDGLVTGRLLVDDRHVRRLVLAHDFAPQSFATIVIR